MKLKAVLKLNLYNDLINKRIDKKTRAVLFKTGAYGIKVEKNMMPTSDKSSRPGRPPHARKKRAFVKNRIRFAVDMRKREVIFGPELWTGSKLRGSSKPLPQLLNEGGQFRVSLDSGRTVTRTMRPRPFTDRALEVTNKFFRQQIADIPL